MPSLFVIELDLEIVTFSELYHRVLTSAANSLGSLTVSGGHRAARRIWSYLTSGSEDSPSDAENDAGDADSDADADAKPDEGGATATGGGESDVSENAAPGSNSDADTTGVSRAGPMTRAGSAKQNRSE